MRKFVGYASIIAFTIAIVSSKPDVAATELDRFERVRTAPAAATSSCYLPDDTDSVGQAATKGLETHAANISSNADASAAALAELAAAASEQQKDLAALAAEIHAQVEQIKALRNTIQALRNQANKLHELLAEAQALESCAAMRSSIASMFAKLIGDLQARIREAESKNQPTDSLKRELLALIARRDEAIKTLDIHCAKVAAQLKKLEEEITRTAKVRRVLETISTDRAKAAQFTELIRKGDRAGLTAFLQRESGGGDFTVGDAKLTTGPLIIFRVDAVSHCLSAGSQCSGKAYSFTN